MQGKINITMIIIVISMLFGFRFSVAADATVKLNPNGLPKTNVTFVLNYSGDVTGFTLKTPDGRTYSATTSNGTGSAYIGDAPSGEYTLTINGAFTTFSCTFSGSSSPTTTATPTTTAPTTVAPTTTPTTTAAPTTTATPTTKAAPTKPTTAANGATTAPEPTTIVTTSEESLFSEETTPVAETDETIIVPTEETTDPTNPIVGWIEGINPTPIPEKDNDTTSKVNIKPFLIVVFIILVIVAIIAMRLPQKIGKFFGQFFRAGGQLSEAEMRLKAKYENALEVEQKALLEDKNHPSPNIKED